MKTSLVVIHVRNITQKNIDFYDFDDVNYFHMKVFLHMMKSLHIHVTMPRFKINFI